MATPTNERDATIKLVVIGAGAWGMNHVRVAHELGHLQAVVDPNPATRAEVRDRFPGVSTFENTLSLWESAKGDLELNGAIIATPATTHKEVCYDAMRHGLDVLVEKPAATTLQDAKDMVNEADRLNRIFMVGHILLYHPVVETILDRTRRPEFGRVRYAYSNRLNLGKVRREENVLWSFAPHDFAVLLELFQGAPRRLDSRGSGFLNSEVADVSLTSMEFQQGTMAHVFVSWLHPYKDHKMVIVGENEMLVFEDSKPHGEKLMAYSHDVSLPDHGQPITERAEATPVPVNDSEPLAREVCHFVECIQTRKPPRTGPQSALQVMAMLEQAEHSMVDHKGDLS